MGNTSDSITVDGTLPHFEWSLNIGRWYDGDLCFLLESDPVQSHDLFLSVLQNMLLF